ncbi:hypothetical protein [Bradyrhizobium retamae]|uniref:Uncharacterized protein n=1 Tax=Bradyrhizobium retamae TaxID=1300035 RepID=A0A0R3M8N4_9BRAD|nr:hypothetical protein [Bradyrhizobium retamae]KRR16267.1 hypothetical protein CQ13_36990 [Bradyrhizobium retamae]
MDVTNSSFRRETLRASQETANPGLIKLVTDRYFKRERNGRYLLGESVSDLLKRVKAQKRKEETSPASQDLLIARSEERLMSAPTSH